MTTKEMESEIARLEALVAAAGKFADDRANPSSEATNLIVAAINKATVQAALESAATRLGMAKTVSSDEYGLLIAGAVQGCKADGLTGMAFLRAFMALWVHIPKNPSAMRQALFERKEATARTIDWNKLAPADPASEQPSGEA
jgi:hypothetical protein